MGLAVVSIVIFNFRRNTPDLAVAIQNTLLQQTWLVMLTMLCYDIYSCYLDGIVALSSESSFEGI